MTTKRRGPSEAQRALWALSGVHVPAVGDMGTWRGRGKAQSALRRVRGVSATTGKIVRTRERVSTQRRLSVPVRVTRVAMSGKTVWIRFAGELPRDLPKLPRRGSREVAVSFDPTFGFKRHGGWFIYRPEGYVTFRTP